MDDRYLWDKTGPVDADVECLERELGRLRHERSSPHATGLVTSPSRVRDRLPFGGGDKASPSA